MKWNFQGPSTHLQSSADILRQKMYTCKMHAQGSRTDQQVTAHEGVCRWVSIFCWLRGLRYVFTSAFWKTENLSIFLLVNQKSSHFWWSRGGFHVCCEWTYHKLSLVLAKPPTWLFTHLSQIATSRPCAWDFANVASFMNEWILAATGWNTH